MTLLFYDFEVFAYDWLVVIANPYDQSETVIINDRAKLQSFYDAHKNDIWIGYNSREYDQYVLKAILCGFNPKELSDWIIVRGERGWAFSRLLNTIKLNNFDLMTTFHGLKTLEGFMGNNIKETSVPFDIQRPLTPNEIAETITYCRHDVQQTMEVFIKRKDEFESHMSLIKTFDLPLSSIGKTKAQLSAMILDCVRPAQDRDDEWDIQYVDTLRIKKYAHVLTWFKSKKNQDYDSELTINVAGVPHTFGWGGLHGARNKYHATGLILHVDVNSFYPAIMIEYDLLSRNVKNKDKYRLIRDKRLEYKKAKNPLQAPYKIVLNGTYGITKDKTSSAYDPRQANNICINGQLLLLDLIEHLEAIPSFELIQSNTDGLIIKVENSDEAFEMVDDICYEWESRTRMGLGFDFITEIYQKDVNNYVFIQNDGKIERKGAYVKELNDLSYDLPIVNKALVEYMVHGTPVAVTINRCDELIEFQKIVKVSSKYKHGWHNGEILNDKTFRVFASLDWSDSYIGKQKCDGCTIEKFANTPEHCFIDNDDVRGKKVPTKLDKSWYIDTALKRLKDYGLCGV